MNLNRMMDATPPLRLVSRGMTGGDAEMTYTDANIRIRATVLFSFRFIKDPLRMKKGRTRKVQSYSTSVVTNKHT